MKLPIDSTPSPPTLAVCKNPLSQAETAIPIQSVLRILASQEGCDGDPWDQMIQAAEYIDFLHQHLEKMKKSNTPETNQESGYRSPSAPRSTVVTWQEAKFRPMNDEAVALKAWVLALDGKTILTAVSVSEIREAVTLENRKMIGQALAEYQA